MRSFALRRIAAMLLGVFAASSCGLAHATWEPRWESDYGGDFDNAPIFDLPPVGIPEGSDFVEGHLGKNDISDTFRAIVSKGYDGLDYQISAIHGEVFTEDGSPVSAAGAFNIVLGFAGSPSTKLLFRTDFNGTRGVTFDFPMALYSAGAISFTMTTSGVAMEKDANLRYRFGFDFDPALAVPEPESWALFAAGLGIVAWFTRRQGGRYRSVKAAR
jgi:hypothetical protein